MTPPDSTLPALPRPVCAQAYLAARITDWQAWLDRKPARKPRALDVTHPAERSERKRRKPTLANIVKQARKAGIDPARIEIKPDGSYVVDIGKPEPAAPDNPWLSELQKRTKQ